MLPEIPIAGATADLVLVVAVTATLVMGIEDGLIAAFVGGLLIDMLVPARPLGAETLRSCSSWASRRPSHAWPGRAADGWPWL